MHWLLSSWRWSRIAHTSKWGVPPFHPSFTWIQVLVLGHQIHCHCLGVYFLWILQCPRILAYTRDVLYHTLLPHDETTDQGMPLIMMMVNYVTKLFFFCFHAAYDQVPLHTFHPWQTKVSGRCLKKYSWSHPKEMKLAYMLSLLNWNWKLSHT